MSRSPGPSSPVRRRWLVVVAIVLIGDARVASAEDPCRAESLERAPTTKEAIAQEFLGAVLRISVDRSQAEPEIGTGYLIDSERGYVLTAGHVVETGPNGSEGIIEATSPSIPNGEKLRLKVVKRSTSSDMALLQVVNVSLLARIRSLDIALDFPPSRTYFTIGYPLGKLTPNVGTAELLGKNDQTGRLEVSHYVERGSSGSPLIDSTGAVLATCVEKDNYAPVAHYEPLVDAEDLLDAIPADPGAEALDRDLRGDAGAEQLKNRLRWRSGNPSNVSLYAWAGRIGKDRSSYASRSRYFGCPILPAYVGRHLVHQAVRTFAGLAPPALQAEALVSVAAQEALQLGRRARAEDLSREAARIYQSLPESDRKAGASPGAYLTREEVESLRARCGPSPKVRSLLAGGAVAGSAAARSEVSRCAGASLDAALAKDAGYADAAFRGCIGSSRALDARARKAVLGQGERIRVPDEQNASWARCQARWLAAQQKRLPLVVLMDSHAKGVVYCADTFERKGSNSDDIAKLLSDLPIALASVGTSPRWHDEERVSKLHPDLVVVHASAFYEETQEIEANLRLLSFLDALKSSGQRVLVYTRGLPGQSNEGIRIRWANLVGKINLTDTAQLFVMPKGHDSCFQDPEVAGPFKKAIQAALGM